jgi:stage III sporulation protein AA
MNGRKGIEGMLYAFPPSVRKILSSLSQDVLQKIEEVRLRANRPLAVYLEGSEKFVSTSGELSNSSSSSYIVTVDDCEKAFQLVSQSSLYAFEEEIKSGYITLKGGYRVGLAGECVLEKGSIKIIKNVSGYNYRISKEVLGAADEIMEYLIDRQGSVYNLLIISPPQCGKTTLLRDIARALSDGFMGFDGKKVCIIDERSEIAGCYNGVPQLNVGIRTDVLDRCPKAEGMIMAIRSMSPQVVVTDEIGKKEDIEALRHVLNAGVKIISTVHAKDIEDLKKRPLLKDLVEGKYFERYIILSNRFGAGTLEEILDENLKMVFKGPYKKGLKKS